MIIGITGTLGAGKGTVVDFLKKKGFKHYSAREFIVEELKRRNLEPNRDSMVFVANDLRKKFGSSYIAESLYKKAQKDGGDGVIESLRTLGEIEALRKKGKFYLFGIDAPPEIRFERIKKRKSETDSISFEKFISDERREFENSDPSKGNLKSCLEKSDFKFYNEGSIPELWEKVQKVLDKIKKEGAFRPNWDEYFIEVSKTVAKRATCSRGRSGCVIAKDKQILVTGYVGSPKGLPHCDEVGHQFKKTIHGDGRVTEHCVRTTHAEQNAICQAAKWGISINGATLYCKMAPCIVCAKMIINSGIKRVVCEKDYQASSDSKEMFKKAEIELEILEKEIESY